MYPRPCPPAGDQLLKKVPIKEEPETGHSELVPKVPYLSIRRQERRERGMADQEQELHRQAMPTPSGAELHESEEWRGRTSHGHSTPGKNRHLRFRRWCFFLARRKLLLIKVLHLSRFSSISILHLPS